MSLDWASLGQEAGSQPNPIPGPAPLPLPLIPSQPFGTDATSSLVAALVTLVVTYVAVGLARTWLTRVFPPRVDPGTRILVRRMVSVSLVVLGLLTALGFLGVSPAALVTLVGAVGLAFSLAVQDILKNFFSGLYLLLERPFRVGDEIRVKEQRGVVENIGVRTTTLRTTDNVEVLVPNALVFAEVVTNHTNQVPAPASANAPAADALASAAGDAAVGPPPAATATAGADTVGAATGERSPSTVPVLPPAATATPERG